MSAVTSSNLFLKSEDDLFCSVENPIPDTFDDFFDSGQYQNEADIKHEDDDSENSVGLDLTLAEELTNDRTNQSERSSSAQPWRKGLWSLKEQPDSQLLVQKTRKGHDTLPELVSPAHLMANDNCAFRTSRSETKSMSPYRVQNNHCYNLTPRQRIDRERSLSPTPMYARSIYDEKAGFVDVWQQEFPEFNLELNDDLQNPFTNDCQLGALPDYSYGRRAVTAYSSSKMEQIHARTMQNFTRNIGSDPSAQELSSIMHANIHAANRNMFTGTPDRTDIAYKFINDDLPAMSDWTTTESQHSSSSSHNSHFSASSVENRYPSMYNTLPPQRLQFSPSLSHAQSQKVHARHASQPELMQPKPLRSAHYVLNQDHFEEGGLGIQYPTADEIGVAIPYQPQPTQQSRSSYHRRTQTQANSLATYPPLPPPTQIFSESSPFSTPRRRAADPQRTPSPDLSPTRGSRSMRSTRSPSRRETSQHHRSKSLHRSGPKGAPETPRNRSMSRSRAPRTPKTPQTAGPIGFVNFTPKDANKLLNDVAPSGSSKTRARRDAEARDRRKKLSEAALAAVKRAGGDVEALERAIMI